MATDVFLSVGRTATPRQEEFVKAVEGCLIARGLMPRTVGRSEFSSVQPLKRVEELMNECHGTVVVAFERLFVEDGVEMRGGKDEAPVRDAAVPTPWNQIEAAMAYVLKHPILVISERGLRGGGLIERGYDWYVLSVDVDPAACASSEFVGAIEDWKARVEARRAGANEARNTAGHPADLADLTIAQIVASLRPAQLWAVLAALASLVAASYAMGAIFSGQH